MGNKPYYSAKVVNGATVVFSDLQKLKYYFDRTMWVRVPFTVDHPYHYNPPVYRTTSVNSSSVDNGWSREVNASWVIRFSPLSGVDEWVHTGGIQPQVALPWGVLHREPVLSSDKWVNCSFFFFSFFFPLSWTFLILFSVIFQQNLGSRSIIPTFV